MTSMLSTLLKIMKVIFTVTITATVLIFAPLIYNKINGQVGLVTTTPPIIVTTKQPSLSQSLQTKYKIDPAVEAANVQPQSEQDTNSKADTLIFLLTLLTTILTFVGAIALGAIGLLIWRSRQDGQESKDALEEIRKFREDVLISVKEVENAKREAQTLLSEVKQIRNQARLFLVQQIKTKSSAERFSRLPEAKKGE